MQKIFLKLAAISGVIVLLGISNCKNDTSLEKTALDKPYKLNIPPGFPQPYLSEKNPLTEKGVILGRMLYNDPILSTNGSSCSSCHQSQNSFSKPVHHFNNGYNISVMPHINLAFKKVYNWEGSAPDLDLLPLGDFVPEIFNTDEKQLFNNLSKHPEYPALFKAAFGINDINSLSFMELKIKISYAIVQYLRTMISVNSKFDRYIARSEELSPLEEMGRKIFFTEKGDCFHCHGGPLFTDNDFHNNGVDSVFEGFNLGYNLVTQKANDIGKFHTPTLRNIELTAPYMHDGRFATLEDVVEFYNSGVHNTNTLDAIMFKRKNVNALNLTDIEKLALVQFLKTLTDTSFHNM